MKTKNHYRLGLAPEAAARNAAGGGYWEMGRKLPKGEVICRNGGEIIIAFRTIKTSYELSRTDVKILFNGESLQPIKSEGR